MLLLLPALKAIVAPLGRRARVGRAVVLLLTPARVAGGTSVGLGARGRRFAEAGQGLLVGEVLGLELEVAFAVGSSGDQRCSAVGERRSSLGQGAQTAVLGRLLDVEHLPRERQLSVVVHRVARARAVGLHPLELEPDEALDLALARPQRLDLLLGDRPRPLAQDALDVLALADHDECEALVRPATGRELQPLQAAPEQRRCEGLGLARRVLGWWCLGSCRVDEWGKEHALNRRGEDRREERRERGGRVRTGGIQGDVLLRSSTGISYWFSYIQHQAHARCRGRAGPSPPARAPSGVQSRACRRGRLESQYRRAVH